MTRRLRFASIDHAPVTLASLRVQEAVYRSHAEGRRVALADFDPLA